MKKLILSFCILHFAFCNSFSQNLPHIMTEAEKLQAPLYNLQRNSNANNVLSVTPPSSPVRTIGEWEELQGLMITWAQFTPMLKEIVRAAKQETRVYIVCSNAQTVINYLNLAPSVDTVNVSFVIAPFNSVWCRDYGPWSAYTNDVDTLITIDWIYNRPRPLDDALPSTISTLLGTPFYTTTTPPWDLVNTGGNFMTDGFGTAFASNLILLDNDTNTAVWGVQHTAAEIDTIMKHFMGISRYIKMNTLPYDQIHHIDMHMKLLDEETLLVGEYPAGIADGPQIEANLQYILANFNSVFGTPYKVIRIPMPADGGLYPNNGGDYFTYTNSSFINKTVIVPIYNIPSDTTALNIYREALPGYTITGINSTSSISSLGALHCITKELGTSDPLLISHQPLPDTYDDVNPYTVNALVKHRSGIQSATLYYRTDTLVPYTSANMTQGSNPDYWSAQIPAQAVGTFIYYYIHGESVSGKQQNRPLPAPTGYWRFEILGPVGLAENNSSNDLQLQTAFPNPSKGITCIPVFSGKEQKASLALTDMTGRMAIKIFDGKLKKGDNKLFLDSWSISSGAYLLILKTDKAVLSQKLMVK
ncbi:MAG TPA: agmatine deiminase family protein [Bacteroidia bacterium]|nr:agmatine deiminase family protein [Bacteroidia bacterium]